MFKFVITRTLIVTSLMVTIYAPQTLYKSTIPNEEAANQYLDVPQREEALPIVLIAEESGQLTIPDDIICVKAENRKITKGTQFSLSGRNQQMQQMIFCPKQNPKNLNETCLAPKDFADLEQLKCDIEPTPQVIKNTHPATQRCGIEGSGTLYRVLFPICPPDPRALYQYTPRSVAIYDFCYDEYRGKILFTSHHINSPQLLAIFLLHQDRKRNYPYERDTTLPIANYGALYTESNSSVESRLPDYVVQNLVPIEDMPFGIWRKPINRSVNIELQQRDLFHVWNHINNKVREEAIRVSGIYNNIHFLVKTAVLNIGVPPYGYPHALYNRWVKMILLTHKRTNQPISGVVFFINNFLNPGFELAPELEKFYYGELDTYCQGYDDVCTRNLKQRALNYGLWVRCCKVTPEIGQLFGEQIPHLPQLKIQDLTLTPQN